MPSIASCEPVRALRLKFHVSELIGALLARAARREARWCVSARCPRHRPRPIFDPGVSGEAAWAGAGVP